MGPRGPPSSLPGLLCLETVPEPIPPRWAWLVCDVQPLSHTLLFLTGMDSIFALTPGISALPLGAGRGLGDPKGLCKWVQLKPVGQQAVSQTPQVLGLPGLGAPWLAPTGEGQTPPGTDTPGSFAFPSSSFQSSLPPTCSSPINVKGHSWPVSCSPKSCSVGQPEGALLPGCLVLVELFGPPSL